MTWGISPFHGGCNRAAFLVREDEDEFGSEVFGGVFDAAQNGVVYDVPGYSDDEQVAQALIEYELRRNSGIGATQDHGERMLSAH